MVRLLWNKSNCCWKYKLELNALPALWGLSSGWVEIDFSGYRYSTSNQPKTQKNNMLTLIRMNYNCYKWHTCTSYTRTIFLNLHIYVCVTKKSCVPLTNKTPYISSVWGYKIPYQPFQPIQKTVLRPTCLLGDHETDRVESSRKVERLTFTVLWEMTPAAEIVDTSFCKADRVKVGLVGLAPGSQKREAIYSNCCVWM